MRQHGVDMPDPQVATADDVRRPASDGTAPSASAPARAPGSTPKPEFKAADEACKDSWRRTRRGSEEAK